MTALVRYFFLPAVVTLASSCTFERQQDCSPAEIELAEKQGERDALKACYLDSGTMAREQAIISIRVKEEVIRTKGFESAADAYADAAELTLRCKGVIE